MKEKLIISIGLVVQSFLKIL